MVRKCALLLLVFYAIVTVIAQDPGFRGLRWGMSRDAVIQAEGRPDRENESEVVYDSTLVAGHEASLSFAFGSDGGLVSGGYTFTAHYVMSRADEYTRDFDDIDQKLGRIHGEPSMRKDEWRAGRVGSRGDVAIRNRSLALFTGWDVGDTTILHVMLQGRREVEHVLIYRPAAAGSAADFHHYMMTSGL